MADPERRRRRLRHLPGLGKRQDAPAEPVAMTAELHDPDPTPPGRRAGAATSPGSAFEDRETERGLRGLIGSGASQIGVGAALRARDASRPTDADLAEAEENLVVVRRNWVPREDLPRGGR